MEKPTIDSLKFEQDIIYLKLLLCIRNKDWDAMKSIIEANPFVLSYRKGGNTLLHQSLILSQVDLLSFLIDQKADIEATDALGQTPLMKAVIFDKPKSIICLLDRQAQIDKQDLMGNSALHHALSCYNPLLIDLLIAKGANIHLKNHQSTTPEEMRKSLFKRQKGRKTHLFGLNSLRAYPPRSPKPVKHSFPLLLKENLYSKDSWSFINATVIASVLIGLALLGAPAWALLASGFAFCGFIEVFSRSNTSTMLSQREIARHQMKEIAPRPDFVAGQFFMKDALNRDCRVKSETTKVFPGDWQQPKAY